MERFRSKVAVITGGAEGIGEAIARRLASEDATVAILDIQYEKARAVADDIGAKRGSAVAVKMDITDSQEVRRAVKEVENRLGKVDVLVNNVGRGSRASFVELSEEDWDRQIAINLRGPITVTRAVLNGMISRNYGRIVNIGSDTGRIGSISGVSAVYSACKGGIIAFTKTLARELTNANILVNCVCPGPTDVPRLAASRKENPEIVEAMISAIPMRRLGKPEDMAAAVAFLASDEASYITGQTLSVSGGLTMM